MNSRRVVYNPVTSSWINMRLFTSHYTSKYCRGRKKQQASTYFRTAKLLEPHATLKSTQSDTLPTTTHTPTPQHSPCTSRPTIKHQPFISLCSRIRDTSQILPPEDDARFGARVHVYGLREPINISTENTSTRVLVTCSLAICVRVFTVRNSDVSTVVLIRLLLETYFILKLAAATKGIAKTTARTLVICIARE